MMWFYFAWIVYGVFFFSFAAVWGCHAAKQWDKPIIMGLFYGLSLLLAGGGMAIIGVAQQFLYKTVAGPVVVPIIAAVWFAIVAAVFEMTLLGRKTPANEVNTKFHLPAIGWALTLVLTLGLPALSYKYADGEKKLHSVSVWFFGLFNKGTTDIFSANNLACILGVVMLIAIPAILVVYNMIASKKNTMGAASRLPLWINVCGAAAHFATVLVFIRHALANVNDKLAVSGGTLKSTNLGLGMTLAFIPMIFVVSILAVSSDYFIVNKKGEDLGTNAPAEA